MWKSVPELTKPAELAKHPPNTTAHAHNMVRACIILWLRKIVNYPLHKFETSKIWAWTLDGALIENGSISSDYSPYYPACQFNIFITMWLQLFTCSCTRLLEVSVFLAAMLQQKSQRHNYSVFANKILTKMFCHRTCTSTLGYNDSKYEVAYSCVQ